MKWTRFADVKVAGPDDPLPICRIPGCSKPVTHEVPGAPGTVGYLIPWCEDHA